MSHASISAIAISAVLLSAQACLAAALTPDAGSKAIEMAAVAGDAGSPAAAPAGKLLPAGELDQLVAPIALYPDDLLATVLMAATYPLEVIQADRWARNNKTLKGDALAAALAKQPWDDTVKSLVATPQVLAMMSEQLEWTQKLGDAVLAQQADVLAAVQRLRLKAETAGHLKTTKEQTVSVEAAPAATGGGGAAGAAAAPSQVIVIQSAQPSVTYVPYYDPGVVYGAWAYPSYPPYYWPPAQGYYGYYPGWVPGRALASGIAFGIGVAWVNGITGGFNWGSNNINIGQINIGSGNNIGNGNSVNLQKWEHNPVHRGGVRYSNTEVTAKFSKTNAVAVGNRAEYRGRTDAGAGNLQGKAGAEDIRSKLGAAGGGNPQGRVGNGDLKGKAGGGDLKAGAGAGRLQGKPATADVKAKAGAGKLQGKAGGGNPPPKAGAGNLKAGAGAGGAFSGVDQGGAAARADAARGQASIKSYKANAGAKPAGNRGGGRGGRELPRR